MLALDGFGGDFRAEVARVIIGNGFSPSSTVRPIDRKLATLQCKSVFAKPFALSLDEGRFSSFGIMAKGRDPKARAAALQRLRVGAEVADFGGTWRRRG